MTRNISLFRIQKWRVTLAFTQITSKNVHLKLPQSQKKKIKYKILVWAAISEKGISRPYVGRVRGEAVDANIYTYGCLPNLLNFISDNHQKDGIMFWPDLASCHYTRITRDWLAANKIPFVPRNNNPPNIPQARPIETLWSMLSRRVYDSGWEATDEEHLPRRIY